MEVFHIEYFNDLPKLEKCSCVIGAIDGLHLGHKSLINELNKFDTKKLVISFENLKKANYQLSTTKQKVELLESLGIDYFIVFPYHVIEKVLYTEFINMLKKLKVKNIVCGEDFRFGYKREGDVIDLCNHFNVIVKDYTMYNQTRVSTSIIKEAIVDGNVELASKLLERDYSIIGEVIHGSKIGSKLGFPTANINYTNYLLPKNGVYVAKVIYDDKMYIGMANIGHNPTINEQKERRLEVHILNFDEEIYGREIEIRFIKFLREEKKFVSKEELISNLNSDYENCKKYLFMLQ